MALQYRQLDAPAQLDTSIPDNGSAAAAQQLARTLSGASDLVHGYAAQIQEKQGAAAGGLAGAAGNPEQKGGISQFTAYGRAYNNAATRSYAIKAEADAQDSAARLMVEAGTDANHFQTTFSAVRDETMKAAPASARPILADIYNQYMGQGVAKINTARALELRNNARTDLSEGVSRLTEQAGNLLGQDDPASRQQAEEAQVKLGMLIDGAQRDNTISDTEAAAMHVAAHRNITMQTVTARFQKELDNPYGDPIGFLERLHKFNETDQALLPEEKAKLESQLFADLSHRNTLDNEQNAAARALLQEKQRKGDQMATAAFLSGTLAETDLTKMVRSGDLTPENARTLYNMMKEGDPKIDDSREFMNVSTDLLSYTADEIRADSKLSFKSRTDLILKLQEKQNSWENTQDAGEAKARIDRALGIVPGTIMATLTDDQARQRQRALTQWYNEVQALDPKARQTQAIPTAERIIGTVIKGNAVDEAASQRRLKAAYIKNHPTDSMGKHERAKYEQDIAGYDARIKDAEMKAQRQ